MAKDDLQIADLAKGNPDFQIVSGLDPCDTVVSFVGDLRDNLDEVTPPREGATRKTRLEGIICKEKSKSLHIGEEKNEPSRLKSIASFVH